MLVGLMLGGPTACSTTSSDDADGALPADQTVQVITAEDVTVLDSEHHLTLDVRLGSYQFDRSAGSLDLTYVDVVGPAGVVESLAQLLTRIEDVGQVEGDRSVTRESLERGFLVSASEDQIEVRGWIIDGPNRAGFTCWRCVCLGSTCSCRVAKCPDIS